MSDPVPARACGGEELQTTLHRSLELARELRDENDHLRQRLAEAEAECRRLLERQEDVEQESDRLANLYVACCQLHSTLDLDEVLRIVVEISINLVGAELFAIHLIDAEQGQLRAIASEGVARERVPSCPVGAGRLGEAVSARETRIFDPDQELDLERPRVCIPLLVEGRAIGAIAIYKLLRQKPGFSALDHELFGVLASHAATAILAARLASRSGNLPGAVQGPGEPSRG